MKSPFNKPFGIRSPFGTQGGNGGGYSADLTSTRIIALYGQSLGEGATPEGGSGVNQLVSVEASKNITNVAWDGSKLVVTSAGHGYSNGTEVFIKSVGGTTHINNRSLIAQNVTTDTFSLTYYDGVTVPNGSAYTSGGTVAKVLVSGTHRTFNGGTRLLRDDRLNTGGTVNSYNPAAAFANLSSLIYLRERATNNVDPAGGFGETFAYGMGLNITPPSVFFNCAQSAQLASSLARSSSTYFQNLQVGARQAAVLLDAEVTTRSDEVFIIYRQGEADGGASATPPATWKTTVQGIKTDIGKTFRHSLKRTPTVRFILDQLASYQTGLTYHDIAVAAGELHDPDNGYYLAGPTYWVSFQGGNDLHMTAASYRIYGEHLGRVVQKIVDTGTWNPCRITNVSRSSTTITVTVHVPEGNLTTDTVNVADYGTGKGFTYSGATITNVSIGATASNTCTITITIDASAGGTLGYAYDNGTSGFVGPTLGAGGNIRDSSTFVASYASTPVYNWLCRYKTTVA